MPDKTPLVTDQTLGKVVKAAAELSLPGFSCYMDRQIGEGALHTLGSLVAASLFGPIGYVLVGANSFSKSESGKNLLELVDSRSARQEPVKASHK
jgi:hypothetical protein